MNGNVTKAGITADLEAMKRIGLGGATVVNVDCGIPRGTASFMGPEWRDDFKFAVAEADRLGLKLCVENCAGWSSSGGPWNTPANAMQRLTSTETTVEGPARFDAVLGQPQTNLKTYHDVAVLAFKVPADVTEAATRPSAAAGKLEVERAVFESQSGGGSADVRATILKLIQGGKKAVTVDPGNLGGDPAMGEVKRLRLVFTLDGKPGTLSVDEGDTLIFPTSEAMLAKARLAGRSSFDRTFVHPPKGDGSTIGVVVLSDGVIDLTADLSPDGRLTWDAPAGKWVVMRLGHTPIGVTNHPAPDEGAGARVRQDEQGRPRRPLGRVHGEGAGRLRAARGPVADGLARRQLRGRQPGLDAGLPGRVPEPAGGTTRSSFCRRSTGTWSTARPSRSGSCGTSAGRSRTCSPRTTTRTSTTSVTGTG